jgi:hypothetical protein
MSQSFHFTAGQRRTLHALTHITCPPDVAARRCEDRIIGDVELALGSFPPFMRLGVLASLVILEWFAVLVPASFGRRFSSLPRAGQERYFAACWHHRLALVRQAMKGVKGLIAMAYYELPEVKERLGYRPEPWIASVKAMRVERFSDAIREQEQKLLSRDALVPATRLERRQNDGSTT